MPEPIQTPPETYPPDSSGVKVAHRPRHVFVFINGILAAPGDAEGWTDRAVTFTHLHTEDRAEKFEYLSGALTRRLKQQARAEKFARMIGYYQRAGWTVSLVGHSNGCDLILRILALVSTPIHCAHLVAAACDADFEQNGLNRHLEIGHLGRVCVYHSPDDKALKLARVSAGILGWLGLGYGSLGLTGPSHVSNWVRGRCLVTDYARPGFDHGDWFAKGSGFEATVQLIHRLDELGRA